MFKQFPFYKQRDAMDCGPTCLMMIAEYHGKTYSLPYLRELCHISREGVSALGIMQGGEAIGLLSLSTKVTYDQNPEEGCLLNAPLPCVAHWNQNHFVVIYKVTQQHVWIADPAAGKFKLKRSNFEKSWISDTERGVILLFDTSPEFFNRDNPIKTSFGRLGSLLTYLNPYSGLITQLVIAMFLGSLFQLILPFLTQSIVDTWYRKSKYWLYLLDFGRASNAVFKSINCQFYPKSDFIAHRYTHQCCLSQRFFNQIDALTYWLF
jgi:ATP-binding cassette subfamily B protein